MAQFYYGFLYDALNEVEDTDRDYLNEKQLAELLGLSLPYIRNLRQRGGGTEVLEGGDSRTVQPGRCPGLHGEPDRCWQAEEEAGATHEAGPTPASAGGEGLKAPILVPKSTTVKD